MVSPHFWKERLNFASPPERVGNLPGVNIFPPTNFGVSPKGINFRGPVRTPFIGYGVGGKSGVHYISPDLG